MHAVGPTPAEVGAALPGDEHLDAGVVVDRGFDLPVTPLEVWPWLEQLGRGRGGWYLPRALEALVPPGRRALRHLDPTLWLDVGQELPAWGARGASSAVLVLDPPRALVHGARRGAVEFTWALVLTRTPDGTRVHSRVRLAGVRPVGAVRWAVGAVHRAAVAGLAAGVRERVRP